MGKGGRTACWGLGVICELLVVLKMLLQALKYSGSDDVDKKMQPFQWLWLAIGLLFFKIVWQSVKESMAKAAGDSKADIWSRVVGNDVENIYYGLICILITPSDSDPSAMI